MEALAIQINPYQFHNKDAAERLLRYITRTRLLEDRTDLKVWGTVAGYHYHPPIAEIIHEFEYVQKKKAITGSRMCHYVIRIRPETFQRMNNNLNALADYGVVCCNYLFNMQYQCCFAIHDSVEKGLHIHLAINTASFGLNGKLRQYPAEIQRTIKYPLLHILDPYLYTTGSFAELFDDFTEEPLP